MKRREENSDPEKAHMRCKMDFSIEFQGLDKFYNRTTEVIAIPPSFNSLNEKLAHGSFSNLEIQNEIGEAVRSPIPLGSFL
jgi:hypothetical protein